MSEKIYGRNEQLYGALPRDDGWLELRVYHRNQTMRQLLRDHRGDPRYFLGRREAFARSTTRAKSWLAEVLKDYGSHFAAGRVRIILDPQAPEQTGDVTPAPARPAPASTPGRTIALVACVSEKKNRPLAAQELYDSDWFHGHRSAERTLARQVGRPGRDPPLRPLERQPRRRGLRLHAAGARLFTSFGTYSGVAGRAREMVVSCVANMDGRLG